MNTQTRLHRPLEVPMEISAIGPHHPLREHAETFVKEKFAQAYSACITEYLPCLVCLHEGDDIKACIGVRSGLQPLFLEQYLDTSLAQADPQLQISRHHIVELGNLVSSGRQYTLLLFLLLAQGLSRAGFQQLLFSATSQVARILRRSGQQLHPIVEADGNRLGASLSQWGNYYQYNPVVMRMSLQEIQVILQASPFLQQLVNNYHASLDDLANDLLTQASLG